MAVCNVTKTLTDGTQALKTSKMVGGAVLRRVILWDTAKTSLPHPLHHQRSHLVTRDFTQDFLLRHSNQLVQWTLTSMILVIYLLYFVIQQINYCFGLIAVVCGKCKVRKDTLVDSSEFSQTKDFLATFAGSLEMRESCRAAMT